GKVDPNVRKPTAIVNDTVITGTDVDQRLGLIALANEVPLAKLTQEERDRLRLQILRQLIDETLQIQEAKVAEVVVTPAEINQSYEQIAMRNFKRTPQQMSVALREAGSSDRSLRRQIEGELAWSRYLRRRVEPLVNVGDAEVKAIQDRMMAAKGTEEYALHELYLNASPADTQQVYTKARALVQEIQKGQQPFSAFARQFGESTISGQGGDLGWIRLATLPPQLAEAVQQMAVGQVAGPIETPGGFTILYLTDKRQVLMADQRDAKLSLKQMTIAFPPGTSQAAASARAAEFGKAVQEIKGCGSVDAIAARIGAQVVENDQNRIRDLPAQLQEIVLRLQVGEATPPFGSPEAGVRTLVICGRDDPRGGELPRADLIQGQLEQQRVNLRAQQKLRDLRRDAVVEYR
ncbi:MAG TPA: peptidylprolyl isomerase, partial [Sphingomonas sp.]